MTSIRAGAMSGVVVAVADWDETDRRLEKDGDGDDDDVVVVVVVVAAGVVVVALVCPIMTLLFPTLPPSILPRFDDADDGRRVRDEGLVMVVGLVRPEVGFDDDDPPPTPTPTGGLCPGMELGNPKPKILAKSIKSVFSTMVRWGTLRTLRGRERKEKMP